MVPDLVMKWGRGLSFLLHVAHFLLFDVSFVLVMMWSRSLWIYGGALPFFFFFNKNCSEGLSRHVESELERILIRSTYFTHGIFPSILPGIVTGCMRVFSFTHKCLQLQISFLSSKRKKKKRSYKSHLVPFRLGHESVCELCVCIMLNIYIYFIYFDLSTLDCLSSVQVVSIF